MLPGRASRRLGVLAALAVLVLGGCDRPLGYGMLYWNREVPSLANGQALVLVDESRLDDRYLVRPLTSQTGGLRVPRSMVRRVVSAEAARAESAAYRQVVGLFAQNGRSSGLSVREQPDGRAQQVYRLRPQEVVKVVEPPGSETEVGQYRGRWYHVLTKEGVSGFVFDLYLRVYRQDGDGSPLVLKDVERRTIVNQYELDVLQDKIWYEEERVEEVKAGRLRKRFDDRYFSLDVVAQQVHYSFPPLVVEEKYGQLLNLADSRFQLDGVGMIVDIFNPWRIGVRTILADGQEAKTLVSVDPVQLEGWIDEVVSRDQQRLLTFLSRGLQLRSERYGQVVLVKSGRFSWDGHQQLVAEGLIAAGAEPTGGVDFPYQLDETLAEDYDGVITFTFDGTGSELSFLYKLGQDRVRMRALPVVMTEGGMVNHDYLLYNPSETFVFAGPRYLPNEPSPVEEEQVEGSLQG